MQHGMTNLVDTTTRAGTGGRIAITNRVDMEQKTWAAIGEAEWDSFTGDRCPDMCRESRFENLIRHDGKNRGYREVGSGVKNYLD